MAKKARWRPTIMLRGMNAQGFLEIRNAILMRGLYLDDWSFDGELNTGVLVIGGKWERKTDKRYPLYKESEGVTNEISDDLMTVLRIAREKAPRVLCTNSVANVNAKVEKVSLEQCIKDLWQRNVVFAVSD